MTVDQHTHQVEINGSCNKHWLTKYTKQKAEYAQAVQKSVHCSGYCYQLYTRITIDFISQYSAATTETHINDIVKKIKRENKKLKIQNKKLKHTKI